MELNEYQNLAESTAIYPTVGSPIVYPLMGLVGEVGEFSNKVKKIYRDNKRMEVNWLKGELGDILWYLSALASELDLSLEEIAVHNLKKLSDRAERDKLHGDGDYR